MPAPKSIILHGGRKARRVTSIRLGERLGGGFEGNVYSAEVEIRKGNKTRKKAFALKRFFGRGHAGSFGNPQMQFELMQEIKKLNKEKKLGLRIIPTIRLKKVRPIKGSLEIPEHELILTKMDFVKLGEPIPHIKWIFVQRDVQRQREILSKEGYSISPDAFLIAKTKNGEFMPYIADFGNIIKLDPKFIKH